MSLNFVTGAYLRFQIRSESAIRLKSGEFPGLLVRKGSNGIHTDIHVVVCQYVQVIYSTVWSLIPANSVLVNRSPCDPGMYLCLPKAIDLSSINCRPNLNIDGQDMNSLETMLVSYDIY